MKKRLWVTQTRWEKNSDDGIKHFTSREALAQSVHMDEESGGRVQVFECTPVGHEVFVHKVLIELYEKD